jgi:hypothetical protein
MSSTVTEAVEKTNTKRNPSNATRNHPRREDLPERQPPLGQPSLYGRCPDFASEFQSPMRPDKVVQVNNQKPISVKHERSVIRGIHGVIVVCSSMRRSRRMAAYFFDAALKRPGTRVRWRYLTGCSSPPAAGYVQPTRLPWTAKRFVISRRCSTVRPLMTT